VAASRDGAGDGLGVERAARWCLDSGDGEMSPAVDARTIHAVARVPALGDACVAARVSVDEAFAPAEALRSSLTQRSILLVLMGASSRSWRRTGSPRRCGVSRLPPRDS